VLDTWVRIEKERISMAPTTNSPTRIEDFEALKAGSIFDVTNRSIVMTGAAAGLGLAMTEVLAANGAFVTMVDVNPDALADSAKKLMDVGLAVNAVTLDITDTSALSDAMAAAAARTGRIDAVFANAGISAGPGYGRSGTQDVGRLDQVDRGVWDQVLAVNLTGVMHTMQAAAEKMKAHGGGRIVVTASIAGVRAEPFVGYAYAATKAAVINLVRQAAIELAPHGVLVNCIAPGFLHTDIANGRLRDANVRAELASRAPMGRLGAASEIQGIALYLSSGASSYTTGACIPVDGGLLAQ